MSVQSHSLAGALQNTRTDEVMPWQQSLHMMFDQIA
jgi:hypothetical protein